MKKFKKVLFLSLTVVVLLFSGCKYDINSGLKPNDDTHAAETEMPKTVTLSGSLAVDGDAAPSEILVMLGGAGERSAVTSGDRLDGYEFSLKVVEENNRTNVIPVDFLETDKSKFTLTLETGKVYKITELSITNGTKTSNLSYRYECNGIEREINLTNLTGTEENKLNVFIVPNTDTTDDIPGKIALEIGSTVDKVKYVRYALTKLVDEESRVLSEDEIPINDGIATLSIDQVYTYDSNGMILDSNFEPVTESLSNGIYDLCIGFLENENDDIPLVETYQKVNVFAGFVTDTWISDGSAFFTEVNKFILTNDAIKEYNTPKVFYVKGTYVDPDPSSGTVTKPVNSWGIGNDSNSGTTIKKPFVTLQQAIDTVITANDGTSEYTIYVKDTVSPKVTVTDAGGETVYSASMADFNSFDDTKDLKLTIVGVSVGTTLDGVYSAGARSQKCGPMVKADGKSKLSLTLENLTITNGGTGLYGAGIYNSASAITLENCVISKNTAQNGGGIYNDGGTITLVKCSVSENNGHNGGGIYNKTGTVILENTSVTKNTYSLDDYTDYGKGGGVYNLATFEMINSSIAENTVKKYDSNGGTSVGSGIYNIGVLKTDNVTIEGNKVVNTSNEVVIDDYGIYFDSESSVELKNEICIAQSIVVAGSGATSITSKTPVTIRQSRTDNANKKFKFIVVKEGATLNLTGTAENGIEIYPDRPSSFNYKSTIFEVGGNLYAKYCSMHRNYNETLNAKGGAVEIIEHSGNTIVSLENCTISDCGCPKSGGKAGGIYVPANTTVKLKDTKIACSSSKDYGNAVWLSSQTSILELDGTVSAYNGNPLDVYVDAKVQSSASGDEYIPIVLANTYNTDSNVFVRLSDVNSVEDDTVISNCSEDAAKTFEVYYYNATKKIDEYYMIEINGKLKSTVFTQAVFRDYCANNRSKLTLDSSMPANTEDENVYKYVTSFTIPAEYKSIVGAYATGGVFVDNNNVGATKLVSVTISDSVTEIGEYAFSGCESLTTVNIPSGVTSIGKSAFKDCTSLQSIVLPKGLTSIEKAAFQHAGLTSIVIPNDIEEISETTFQQCTALTSVTLPKKLKKIGNYAFDGEYKEDSATPPIEEYNTVLKEITLPDTLESIGDGAFKNQQGLTSITIPASVTSIGQSAFSGCDALETVTMLSKTPASMGATYGVFPSSTTIYVPAGYADDNSGKTIVEKYKDDSNWVSYSNNIKAILTKSDITDKSIEYYTVQYGVGIISANAFDGCSNLKGVILPDSVDYIGDAAFAKCDILESVTLLKDCYQGQLGVYEYTKLGSEVFGTRSESSFSVYVPDNSVGTYKTQSDWTGYTDCIKTNTFTGTVLQSLRSDYATMTEYTIPWGYISVEGESDGVNSGIGKYVFAGCTALKTVTIPGSVNFIGECAFKGSDYSGSTQIHHIENIIIEEGLKSIRDRVFYDCRDITSITLPSTVTSIGGYAFNDCASLESVTINAATPPTLSSGSLYTGGNTPIVIFVPSSAVQTYKNACDDGGAWDKKGVLSSQIYALGDIPARINLKAGTVRIGLNEQFDISDVVIIEPSNTTDTMTVSLSRPLAGGAVTGVTYADGKLTVIGEQTGIFVSVTVGRHNVGFELVMYESKVFDKAAMEVLSTANPYFEIPYGFTSIECSNGTSPFDGHSAITHLVIPETVTNIGSNVFNDDNTLPFHDTYAGIITMKGTVPPTIASDTFGADANVNFIVPKGCSNTYHNTWDSVEPTFNFDIQEEQ